jgi:hypothetical protein
MANNINDTVARDIERWSDQRLQTWFTDSIDRYKMADLEPSRAMSYVIVSLLMALATILARMSTVDSDEAGEHLAATIDDIRKRQKQRHATKDER